MNMVPEGELLGEDIITLSAKYTKITLHKDSVGRLQVVAGYVN